MTFWELATGLHWPSSWEDMRITEVIGGRRSDKVTRERQRWQVQEEKCSREPSHPPTTHSLPLSHSRELEFVKNCAKRGQEKGSL